MAKSPAKKKAKPKAVNPKGGRPSKLTPEIISQVIDLAAKGLTDKEMAGHLKVSVATVSNWKLANPVFLEALKAGKALADDRVEASLYQRAMGYSHPEVHVSNYQGVITLTPLTKHYPPDTTAAIFWLKNRRKAEWRDRTEHEHTGKDGGAIETKDVSMEEGAKRVLFLLASQLNKQEK